MDLKQEIKLRCGNIHRFSQIIGVQPARVYYWCKTDREKLTWTTKQKIQKYLDEAEIKTAVDN